jgi:hypothetical protein
LFKKWNLLLADAQVLRHPSLKSLHNNHFLTSFMHIFSKPIQHSRRLVAQVAMSGLNHVELPAEDHADFYEGLSSILSPPASEAARYAATCLREHQRAQKEILVALNQDDTPPEPLSIPTDPASTGAPQP